MTTFRNTGQPDWDWWGELWPDPESVLRRLGITAGESVADVCSGNGYFTLPAASLVGEAPVFAVDIDAGLLAELRSLAAERGIENVRTLRGDARDTADLLPGAVDVVLLANTLHGIADKGAFAAGVESALAPDGRFVVVNWCASPRKETTVAGEPRGPPTDLRLTPRETTDVVEPAGFERRSTVELPPYHYGLVFERADPD